MSDGFALLHHYNIRCLLRVHLNQQLFFGNIQKQYPPKNGFDGGVKAEINTGAWRARVYLHHVQPVGEGNDCAGAGGNQLVDR